MIELAGLFTHCLVANQVLEELPKSYRNYFSKPENIDDYYFGSIAPDIRYTDLSLKRNVTHEPFGVNSGFEAFKASSAFVAGYECHLKTDDAWDGEGGIAEFFSIDVNKIEQKLALYYFVDAYFKEKNSWFLPMMFSGNILRANDFYFLEKLGFRKEQINSYKSAALIYLNAPSTRTLLELITQLKIPVNEKQVMAVIDSLTPVDEKLHGFLEDAAGTSPEAILKHL